MRRRKILNIILCTVLLGLICAISAEAATSPGAGRIISVSEAFTNVINNIADNLHAAGTKIFFCLFFVSAVWTCFSIILEGKFEAQNFVMTVTKYLVVAAVFQYFLQGIYGTLKEISAFITTAYSSGSGVTIDSLIDTAFDIAGAPFNALNKLCADDGPCPLGGTHPINDLKYIGCAIVMGIGEIITLVAVFMAYVTAMITQIKLAVVISFAVLAFGFSGSSFTRDIAVNGIRTTIAVSVELLVIYVLIGATQGVFGEFSKLTPETFSDVYSIGFQCILAGIISAALFQQLPGAISGMFGSGGGGGGSPLVGIAMAASAASMAKSAAMMAGKAGSGAAKAAGGAVTGAMGAGAAIKEHMGNRNGMMGASAANLAQGIGGAAKEAGKNRFKSMKEAFNSGIESKKDKFLGRTPGGAGPGSHS